MKKEIPKSNLGQKASGSMDDILYGKPPVKAQEKLAEKLEMSEDNKEQNRAGKTSSKEIESAKKDDREVADEFEEDNSETPARVGRPATPDKVKKHGVMAYFNREIYDEFEDVSGNIKKEVRKKLGLKLKETNLIELCVAYVNETYRNDPQKVVEAFLKLCGDLRSAEKK